MTLMTRLTVVLALVGGVAFAPVGHSQQPPSDGPRYSNGTNLIRPTDYREWIFLSSGLGMTYDPPVGSPPAGSPSGPGFGNVFVNPSSYRSFMQTGKWPNGTIFILEGRNSSSEASINKAGRFQAELAGIEAEVKDSRFPDGWAFFNFGRAPSMKDVAEPLSGDNLASCVECHTKNTAVERTFVQFYPTLFDVAKRLGTVNSTYDPARKP